jgi:hypothetical protein
MGKLNNMCIIFRLQTIKDKEKNLKFRAGGKHLTFRGPKIQKNIQHLVRIHARKQRKQNISVRRKLYFTKFSIESERLINTMSI